jgi:predicted glycogen debranching enzyme
VHPREVDPGDHGPTPRLVSFDVAALAAPGAAGGREWLVTNGLGGYAYGTVAGPPTRTYHGLLVAALQPPVDRTVLVAAARVRVRRGRRRFGGLGVDGGAKLVAFRLDGILPVWTYRIGEALVEQRVWMERDHNVTALRLAVLASPSAIDVEIDPLVTARDHHAVRAAPGNQRPRVSVLAARTASVTLEAPTGPVQLVMTADAGAWAVDGPRIGHWERGIRLPEESVRGQDDRTSWFVAARLSATLEPGGSLTLAFAANAPKTDRRDRAGRPSLARAQHRQVELLEQARALDASPVVRQLVLAADQFLVRRSIPSPGGGPAIDGRSVVAGYPWFNDWGRDTMIALPGLTIATGRFDEAAMILRSFDRFRRDGLLPNNFPDRADEEPAYHTIDATLWFPHAVAAYEAATGDEALVDELLPGVVDSLEWHVRGTRFRIGLDPADGLLRGGAEGQQLTWMDAKLDDWVVTPRRGKPVEVQGLWYNALRLAATWLRKRGRTAEGDRWDSDAGRARASFERRFWRPELGYLADVVDGPGGDELSLRPNQLLAMSLEHPIFDGDRARQALAACHEALLVPCGLRSLAPGDPAYRPTFHGSRRERDAAYHNGAAWTWLTGPYVDAVLRLTGDRALARTVLQPFVAHLSEAGLGTISENLEPEPPFTPRGCVAQAWSVAEILRLWRLLEAPGAGDPRPWRREGFSPAGDSRPRPTRS